MLDYELAYRQGEILIFKVKKLRNIALSSTYQKLKIVPSGVIREGEKEGHEHLVKGGTLSLFDNQEEGNLKVEKEATITHPEHADIKLPKGDYAIKVQKEATGKNASQSVKD